MPLICLLYTLFACMFIIAKYGLQQMQPFFFVGSRMLIAGTILLLYSFFLRDKKQTIQLKDIGWMALYGIFSVYLTNSCEYWALKQMSAAKTCFFYSLSPFITAIFANVIFKEHMTTKKWLGVCIGVVGVWPMLFDGGDSFLDVGFFTISPADLSALFAVISSVAGWMILKYLTNERNIPISLANGAGMLAGGLLSIGNSLAIEQWNPLPIIDYMQAAFCIISIVIVSNLLCYNLYGYLLKQYTVTLLSLAGFMTPILTAFFGYFFLNEPMAWNLAASVLIGFVGLYIFSYPSTQKPAVPVRSSQRRSQI